MKKSSRKAPKRKKSHAGSHKKKHAHHEHEEEALNTALVMDTHILSDSEKHELIRAHAESRNARRKLGVGYYVAIGVSCIAVGAGWLMTLEHNFGLRAPFSSDPAVQSVQESVRSFQNNAAVRIPEVKENIEKAKTQLNEIRDSQKGVVNGTSTESINE